MIDFMLLNVHGGEMAIRDGDRVGRGGGAGIAQWLERRTRD